MGKIWKLGTDHIAHCTKDKKLFLSFKTTKIIIITISYLLTFVKMIEILKKDQL